MANMQPGDWNCAGCGDHQFARNAECRKCGTPNPFGAGGGGMMGMMGGKGGGKSGGQAQKPGDWNCPACGDLQFAKNAVCRKCSTPNPDPAGSLAAKEAGLAAGHGGSEMKPGDWYCPGCNDLQFAKNTVCRKCATPNPDPEASMAAALAANPSFKPGGGKGGNTQEKKPGDWHCSGCGDLQFARNTQCRQCGTPNVQAMMGGGGKGGGGGNMAQMQQMMGMMQQMMGAMGNMGGKGGGNMMGNMMGGGMGNMMGNMQMGGGNQYWTHGQKGGGKQSPY